MQSSLISRILARPKQLIATAGLAAAALGLALSNPDQSEYVNYAADRFPQELKQQCQDLAKDGKDKIDLAGVLSLNGSVLCRSLVGGFDLVGRGLIKQGIAASTVRQNYGIASHYTTEIMGRQIKTLALGNQFITYSSK